MGNDTRDTLTPEEVGEIERRAERETPGTVDYSGRTPRAVLSYEERFINSLRDGPIYARKRAGRDVPDAEIAEHVRPLFAPAYQAHRDVLRLCASLRAAWAERDRLAEEVESMREAYELRDEDEWGEP
jgi:hypothetical protein